MSFGLGKFKNIPEFLEHFESQPIISGESGNGENTVYIELSERERERVHLVLPFIDIVTHIPAGSFFPLKDFLFTFLTLTLAV